VSEQFNVIYQTQAGFYCVSILEYHAADKHDTHPVTLNWHWANQPWSRPLMVNTNQGSSRCQFFSLWLDWPEFDPQPSTLGANALTYIYNNPLGHRGSGLKQINYNIWYYIIMYSISLTYVIVWMLKKRSHLFLNL